MLTEEQEKYLGQLPEQDRGRFREHMVEQAEYLPQINKDVEKQYQEGYMDKGQWGDYFSDDGSLFEVVDSEGQRMWFRHGMVFSPEGDGHGMWVEYQKWSLRSDMQGPVLISDKAFEALVQYYKHCKRRETWWYKIYWSILGHHIQRLNYWWGER